MAKRKRKKARAVAQARTRAVVPEPKRIAAPVEDEAPAHLEEEARELDAQLATAPAEVAEEHREVPRVPIAVEVSLESDHNFYAGVCDNVSRGGLFVATYTHPPTGSEVDLELALGVGDDAARFRLHGVVSWVRELSRATDFAPPGCGIRWVDLPEPAEEAIRRFVDQRQTLLYDED